MAKTIVAGERLGYRGKNLFLKLLRSVHKALYAGPRAKGFSTTALNKQSEWVDRTADHSKIEDSFSYIFPASAEF